MNSEEEILQEEEITINPPAYTCHTLLNVEVQREATEAITPKYTKILFRCLLGVTAVLAIALLIWYFVNQNPMDLYLSMSILALCGYLSYKHFTTPKRMLRQWEEGMQRSFGTSELHLMSEFYEFTIAQTVEECDSVAVDSYKDLSAIIETEHLYLLKKTRTNWYFLDKSGFEDGKKEEFYKFIKEQLGVK